MTSLQAATEIVFVSLRVRQSPADLVLWLQILRSCLPEAVTDIEVAIEIQIEIDPVELSAKPQTSQILDFAESEVEPV